MSCALIDDTKVGACVVGADEVKSPVLILIAVGDPCVERGLVSYS